MTGQLIKAVESELATVDRVISDIERLLVDLKSNRDALEEALNELREATPPGTGIDERLLLLYQQGDNQ